MASKTQPGSDPTVDFLKRRGVKVNRKNYLGMRFMDPNIKPEQYLGAEIEASMPPELRHSKFRAPPYAVRTCRSTNCSRSFTRTRTLRPTFTDGIKPRLISCRM